MPYNVLLLPATCAILEYSLVWCIISLVNHIIYQLQNIFNLYMCDTWFWIIISPFVIESVLCFVILNV